MSSSTLGSCSPIVNMVVKTSLRGQRTGISRDFRSKNGVARNFRERHGEQAFVTLAAEVFKEADEDGSGYIDAREIGSVLKKLGMNLTDAEAAEVMRRYDVGSDADVEGSKSGDGKLDVKEWTAVIGDLIDGTFEAKAEQALARLDAKSESEPAAESAVEPPAKPEPTAKPETTTAEAEPAAKPASTKPASAPLPPAASNDKAAEHAKVGLVTEPASHRELEKQIEELQRLLAERRRACVAAQRGGGQVMSDCLRALEESALASLSAFARLTCQQ